MRRLSSYLGWLASVTCAGISIADQRFPPPEFESGHQLPATLAPLPRAPWIEWLDVGLLLLALGLACYFVYGRRSRRGVFWLSVFSMAYFGFYRKGCICPIGAPQNIVLGIFDSTYAVPITVAVLFLAPLVVSLFAGRTFCAAVCPHGALQDLRLLKPVKVPQWLEQGLAVVPYLFLGAGVFFAATGSTFLICRYDPYVPLFRRSGGLTMLIVGAVFIALAMFIGRPYCRFLCPYGALLRLGAMVSKWRVRITPDFCTKCRLCEDACPFGAIREPVVRPAGANELAPDRHRLVSFILVLPVLVALGGFLGNRLAVPAATLHPIVSLAERYLDPARPPPPPLPTPESLAFERVDRDPASILSEAADIRGRFKTGGWWFGAWIGLVIGLRLVFLTLRPIRTEYEPDRGACVACARCFMFCPNERVRLGLLPPSAVQNATEEPGRSLEPDRGDT